MKKAGVITFHAAHNYGSVLQAYATQFVLEKLGCECEIINYRLKNQRDYYNHLYSPRFGKKDFLNRIMKLSEHKKRKIRSAKFEDFINNRLKLTKKEYNTLSQLKAERFDYDVLLTGSDQVWNKKCVAEFKNEPAESILGYFLDFGSKDVKRVAYSSSYAARDLEYISQYKKYLEKYSDISVRESSSAEMLSQLLNKEVVNTLDPTLVLNGSEWTLDGVYDISEKYIFVYTLSKYHAVNRLLENVKAYADKKGLKVICSAPFSKIKVKGVTAAADCGPLDFLSYVKSAELVVTDSFHGTAFSLNFNTPFYSIISKNDKRKKLLLEKLGLQGRIISNAAELDADKDYKCDFNNANAILDRERQVNIEFLKKALFREA